MAPEYLQKEGEKVARRVIGPSDDSLTLLKLCLSGVSLCL